MPEKLVPSYRLHKGSGQAIVTLPIPGRKKGLHFYLGKFGTKASRETYDQAISLWLELKHSLKKHAAAEIIARLQKLRAGRGATRDKGVTVAEAASKLSRLASGVP